MPKTHSSAIVSVLVLGSLVGCSGKLEDSGGSGAMGGTSSDSGATGGASSQQGENGVTGGSSSQQGENGVTGGSSSQPGENPTPTGGTSGQPGSTSACTGPACCVALALSEANVNVYAVGVDLTITLMVERIESVNPEYAWQPSATVTSSFGGKQDCDAGGVYAAGTRYAVIRCPAVEASAPCGSDATVEINLQVSGYASVDDPNPVCGSGLGMTLTYTVPVECPACPSSPFNENWKPCDMPSDQACWYQSLWLGGQLIPAPCYCQPDLTTGERLWRCAVA